MKLLPKLFSLEQAIRGKQVVFLSVLCYSSFDLCEKWAHEHTGPEFANMVVDEIMPDRRDQATWKFGNVATPSVFLLDPNGRIVGQPSLDVDSAVRILALRLRALGVSISQINFPDRPDYPSIQAGVSLKELKIMSVDRVKRERIVGPAIITFCSESSPDTLNAITLARELVKQQHTELNYFPIMLGNSVSEITEIRNSRSRLLNHAYFCSDPTLSALEFSTPCTILVDKDCRVVDSADPLDKASIERLARRLKP